MKKIIFILSSLLVIQFIITGVVFWHRNQLEQQQVAKVLFRFKPKQATEIVISNNSAKVQLVRHNHQWILPKLDKLPADQTHISDLLSKLTSLKAAWPIADTQSAQKRFKVATGDYHRHILIKGVNGQILANVYLGNSPAFRQIHLRLSKHPSIYQVKLSAYQTSVSPKSWLNTMLLAAKQPGSIDGSDFKLKRDKDVWQWQGEINSNKQVLSQTKAAQLSQALGGMTVTDVATKPIQGKPQFILRITQNSKPLVYRFWHQNHTYQVARSDYPQHFGLNGAQYKQLAKFSKITLLHKVKLKKALKPQLKHHKIKVSKMTPHLAH
ncbi:MAG: hypothetical protein CENE_00541 [Candidatus Celerinatantimonas neptuna]|nr:MAG: hypothetical protein CENE_00541 [Candidatus Celerinatantimonas neptuna]